MSCRCKSLKGELIGFNRRTGMPVQAAAGLGSYQELTPDFYQTYQHENWQHPGSDGWSTAPVPGWGENPNLQMFSRIAVGQDVASSMDMIKTLGAVALGAAVMYLFG